MIITSDFKSKLDLLSNDFLNTYLNYFDDYTMDGLYYLSSTMDGLLLFMS